MNIPSTACQKFTNATVEKNDGKSPGPDERAYAPNSRASTTGSWKFTMACCNGALTFKDGQLASDGFEESLVTGAL